MSKWVGNTAHILGYLFKSASRHCHEVWALQFPFLYNFKDTVLSSEACLYSLINWTQQLSSLGLFSLQPI